MLLLLSYLYVWSGRIQSSLLTTVQLELALQVVVVCSCFNSWLCVFKGPCFSYADSQLLTSLSASSTVTNSSLRICSHFSIGLVCKQTGSNTCLVFSLHVSLRKSEEREFALVLISSSGFCHPTDARCFLFFSFLKIYNVHSFSYSGMKSLW